MKKVFLGGTCNESTWRDGLIEILEIDYFNPVVDDWTEECYREELRQRDSIDVFNPLDRFFSEKCYSFSDEKERDIAIKDIVT